MNAKKRRKCYVVVKVESGIPVMVEPHATFQRAQACEQALRKRMHPEKDETGLFKIGYDPEDSS